MSKQSNQTADRSGNKTYSFRFQGKAYRLTYQQAFSFGHTLMIGGHFEQAAHIFSRLAKVAGRGPRAKIMLAHCQAGVDNHTACHELLKGAFEGENQPIVEDLQAAFVYHKLGMEADAVGEMRKVVEQYENVPTACLLLGDLFAAKGKTSKAVHCWELAVKRDRPGGAVALAARKQLDSLAKSGKHRGRAKPRKT